MATTDRAAVEALWERWMQVWHGGRYELISDCITSPYVRHTPGRTDHETPESYERVIRQARERSPDLRWVVQDLIVEGDQFCIRAMGVATDPKTGSLRKWAYFQLYRVEGGKLAETWTGWTSATPPAEPIGWSDCP
jgi:hypothetical protein